MQFFPLLDEDGFESFQSADKKQRANPSLVNDLENKLSLQTVMLSAFIFSLALLLLYHLSTLKHDVVMALIVLTSLVVLAIYNVIVKGLWRRILQQEVSSATLKYHHGKYTQNFISLLLGLGIINALAYLQQAEEPLLALGLLLMMVVISGILIADTRHLLLLSCLAWLGWAGTLAMVLSPPISKDVGAVMFALLLIATVISFLTHKFKLDLKKQLNLAIQNEARSYASLQQMVKDSQKSEEQYRLLADSTSDGVVIYDQGTILDANSRCGEIFGYKIEKLRGKDWLELIAPRARDVIQARIERGAQDFSQAQIQIVSSQHSPEDSNARNRYESFGLHSQGRVFPLEIAERVMPLEDRYITIATVRDTTRDKETEGRMRSYEEELEQRNAELLRANKLKTSFLANMSHELRTPLTAINGFAELLRGEYFGSLNDKQMQYVCDIHESGKHLLELINGILDLSKVEADKMTLRLQHTDLGALAHEALKIVQAQAAAKAISLEVQSESDVVVLVDPVRIKQVFYNYLSNAVKFTPQGGEVRVHIYNNEHAIITEVHDTGIGIAEEDQGKLFEPFTQLDNSTTRDQEGTGLGLALSRQLIHMHGGEVWLQSKVGEGSTFAFSLPLSLSLLGNPATPSIPPALLDKATLDGSVQE